MTNGTIGSGLPHASAHDVLVVFARHGFRIRIAIVTEILDAQYSLQILQSPEDAST